MTTLIYKTHFDAAHFLPRYTGPCARIHGHTWGVEVEIGGEVNLQTGMIMDFKEIKKVLEGILPDHQFLNDYLKEVAIPTAENLAAYFYEEIKKRIPAMRSVTVWESDHAAAKYNEG